MNKEPSTWERYLEIKGAERDTIFTEKCFVDMAGGDLIAGILLSRIVYWHLPNSTTGKTKLRVKKSGYTWLAKNRKDWWDECRISTRQYDRAVALLSDGAKNKDGTVNIEGLNILTVINSMFDAKRTPFIRINQDVFMAALDKEIKKRQEQQSETASETSEPSDAKCNNDVDAPEQERSNAKCNTAGRESVTPITDITTEITTLGTVEKFSAENFSPCAQVKSSEQPASNAVKTKSVELTDDDPLGINSFPAIPSSAGSPPSNIPPKPAKTKKMTKTEAWNYRPGPDDVIPPPTSGFGFPSRNSEFAKSSRKKESLEKKSLKKTVTEIVSDWKPSDREKVSAYVHAYYRGISESPENVRPPDAAALLDNARFVLDINSDEFSPRDFEEATRHKMKTVSAAIYMPGIEKMRAKLSEWDARGRPKAKIESERPKVEMKNYEAIAAAEKAEWDRLGRPKGWVPE